ncbi:ribonuclease R [Solemya velum gill symbiont]|uniref:ribonuclease R n=1 Tax=Solemya velum gill symbiont TaxID=2340 RepID=UPI0009CE4E38|nr:ribonuclease R [Solemya velum gill symbiont]OOZ13584.1 ribonuclease R [Solemya velum gill symbiont]OOZ18795.1 ribonuclease R [Solemya velum gill symbiont]OOZ21392.1 ribonuclease R [Solemya velum gill symbiont]OOZ23298.1 ribonuclease R [Solemya velum gill symbiont]OOZ28569.1 ribonuclease R [Solemya velum gill symbiont]
MSNQNRSKRKSKRDPNFAREAKKYDNPIPSREFIMESINEKGCPISFAEIASVLAIKDEDQLIALDRRLGAMLRDGQLIKNRKKVFCVIDKEELIVGRVTGHADGFGFLIPEEGGDDLFLTHREMRKLMHGDRAVVRVAGIDNRGRREGTIVEVLERAHEKIVGRLAIEGGVGFVRPDNKRMTQEIIVPGTELNGAEKGDIVVVELIVQPSRRTQPVGKIVEVLGEHLASGMETDIAIRSHEIPVEWPAEVQQAIAKLSEKVPEKAKKGRVDLRKLPLVTIDGEDARDYDDAVYCEATPKGWKLIVAIADVSHYVKPGNSLDKEASSRGTSVYFPGRVVPMLPEILSNGLCSLNPKVDRLCMCCEMLISREGKLLRSRFYEGVMHSHARLTYDKVAAMLVDRDKKLIKEYAEILPHLEELYALYHVLQASRRERGAIDFETVETRIIFDEGKIADIVAVTRNDAHKIIEECMLSANVAAARLLQRKKIPAHFRVHEGPSAEKLIDLRQFLGEMGLSLPGGAKPTAGDYAKLLNQVRERPDAQLIQTVLLRSLSQAVYTTDNLGHFGLSYDAYTHFTSPIRRYPDLLVHRALKHAVNGGKASDFHYSKGELQSFAEHCSTTERRADEASRDALDTLKCEYMLDKVGEKFDGIITSVTSFGLFVMLDGIYVDGLVHITALDKDYFHFDPVAHRLSGERTGKSYRLGDPLRIQVAAVNVDERKIDFVLHDAASRKGADSRPGGKKRSSGKRRKDGGDKSKAPRSRRRSGGKKPRKQGK